MAADPIPGRRCPDAVATIRKLLPAEATPHPPPSTSPSLIGGTRHAVRQPMSSRIATEKLPGRAGQVLDERRRLGVMLTAGIEFEEESHR